MGWSSRGGEILAEVSPGFTLSGGYGDRRAGLTEPLPVDNVPDAIQQNLTGVRWEYRDRGIATTLKAHAPIWAAHAGYTSIRTQSAQSNVVLVSVDKRLGLKRDHATLEFLKTR